MINGTVTYAFDNVTVEEYFLSQKSPQDIVLPDDLAVDWAQVDYYRLNQKIEQEAMYLDHTMVTLEGITNSSYAARMDILRAFRVDALWQCLLNKGGQPYSSFTQWVEERVPFSRKEVYVALLISEKVKDIPRTRVNKMQRQQLQALADLPEKVRQDEEILTACEKGASPNTITEIAKKKYPDQHLEALWTLKMKYTETERKVLKEALDSRKQRDPNITSYEAYFLALAIDDLQDIRGKIADAAAALTQEPPDLVM